MLGLCGGGSAASAKAVATFWAKLEQERRDKEEQKGAAAAAAHSACLDHLFEHFRGTQPEDWELMLLLDMQEHNCNPRVQSMLLQNNVKCQVVRLAVGDMLWVVKRRSRYTQQQLAIPTSRAADGGSMGDWIMLRYVIERKTAEDLLVSIMDGRYNEQKGRLLGVGREVDKAFYLVEGSVGNITNKSRQGVVCTAINHTHVLHGMPVLRTQSLESTIDLLRRMHRQLEHSFGHFVRVASSTKETWASYITTHLPELPLPLTRLIAFEEYQQLCKKRGREMTVREMFTVQLCAMQGISEPKAKALVAAYPTPSALAEAMKRMTEEEAVRALEKLHVPGQVMAFGKKNATLVYKVYS